MMHIRTFTSLSFVALIAMVAACSKETAPSSVAAGQTEAALPASAMPEDESNEPTPAERRLVWVKRPFDSSRTASLQTTAAVATPVPAPGNAAVASSKPD
jgi:hypothetical protein